MVGQVEASKNFHGMESPASPSGIYSPLKENRSIRLVAIDADNGSSSVSCALTETNIDHPVAAYLALSYCWGATKRTSSITCDGKSLPATDSLVAAMKQLRERYPGRMFWIDAICINQQDPVERADQVKLMRDIYRSAENLVIYLGEDCPGLDRAMDLFAQLRTEAAGWTDHVGPDNEFRASTVRSKFPPAYDEAWYRFHDFFNRPWFSRIWVVQEVVMAVGDPDVICGPYTLSWSSMVSVSELFQLTGLSGATIRKSKTSLVSLIDTVRSHSRPLWHLLWLTAPFASSEPRDKVFALYGLAHQAEADMLASEYFQIDYQAPIRDVFRDMMFGYVMHYHSLELMSEAMEVADEDKSVRDLPSWVPDWSLPILTKHPSVGRHAQTSGFDACMGRGTLVQSSMRAINPDVLRIAGKVHDEVVWASNPFDGPEYSPLPWRRRPFVLQKLWDDVKERLGSDRQTCHAFWRTLLANCDRHGSPATNRLYPTFLRFWHDSKVHDQNAVRFGASTHGDLPLTEEQERELFKDYSMDHGKAMTDEDYQASRAWGENLASQYLPCDSSQECRHCIVLAAFRLEDVRLTGPSPALAMRETDPFMGDFFGALGNDPDLFMCDPEMDILTRMRHTLQNRRFIITKGGLMGLGPKYTRVGDAVAVLSGAKVPFVLRRTGRTQVQLESGVAFRAIHEYRVVGDSYVHGIMQGEAVRDLDWENGGYEVLDLV